MKKAFLFVGICSIIAACSSNDSSKNVQDTTPTQSQTSNENRSLTDTLGSTGTESTNAANAGSEKGAALISKLDCLGCHKDHEKLVGPAYVDVAKKYQPTQENIDYLAGKIITGGAGVWGEVPMTPHPALSKEDASDLAKYVLSIK
ncbi:MAG: cytochrome [Sphingobacteriaceae bacterium]|jgi:cytochrome c|nr:cytochrome [Sphingobacteriaceae bacterium]